jgi:hypothetical protein
MTLQVKQVVFTPDVLRRYHIILKEEWYDSTCSQSSLYIDSVFEDTYTQPLHSRSSADIHTALKI